MRKLLDLREHLFDTIEGLKGKTIPVEDGKVIAQVAQTLINSAKIELDFLKLKDGLPKKSEFLEIGDGNPV
jgi:hypothetical protein